MSRMAKEVEITCTIKRETEKAILIYDGKIEVWIPKSQITDQGPDSIFIPEWLAEDKELI